MTKRMMALLLAVVMCCSLLWACGSEPVSTEPVDQSEIAIDPTRNEIYETVSEAAETEPAETESAPATESVATETTLVTVPTETESGSITEPKETQPEITPTTAPEDPQQTETEPAEDNYGGENDLPLG